MQTQVTEAGPFERLVILQIDETDLDQAKNAAARKLSRDMKIKGFRPGKAPRAVVERMVGSETLRKEAIDEALPRAVTEALAEAELRPVVQPRVEDIRDVDDGVEVEVRVTLWPSLERVPDAEGRKITIEAPDVTDEDLEGQIDRLRERFAELEDVSRPADEGDFVLINLTASRDGTAIDEASASDLLYEVGSGSFLPGLDDVLPGASSGEIRDTPTVLPDGFGEHAGEQVDLRVLVKGVRARRLPETTDEWASEVSEFDTMAELRDMLEREIAEMKRADARTVYRQRLVDELVQDLDLDLPEALVEGEMQDSIHDLAHRLEPSGIEIADYLRITGRSEEEFIEELRTGASRALSTRILLDSVARFHGIEVDPEELTTALDRVVAGQDDPEDLRMRLEESGRVELLAGDILRRKALEHLAEVATPVDGDGEVVDLSPLVMADEIDEADETADDRADDTVVAAVAGAAPGGGAATEREETDDDESEE